jgi:NADH-quinone oxidoreductase subunit M
MLWLYQRTMFGKIENPKNETLLDMNLREVMTFVPLIILAIWIGIYPSPFLKIVEPTVTSVMSRIDPAYAAQAAARAAAAKAAKDCEDNKPTTPFTTAPCGPDEAAAKAAAETAPKPAAETGADVPQVPPAKAGEAAAKAEAGGRH